MTEPTLAPSVTLLSSEVPSYVPTNVFAPVPTARPSPFSYAPYGDSAFGYQGASMYNGAGPNNIRYPGWSWNSKSQGPGPFCARDTCANLTNVCDQFGGIGIVEPICAFPRDVSYLGPSCWHDNCYSNAGDEQVCSDIGGVTVSAGNETSWCIFQDPSRTVFGPACYGDDCFAQELSSFCDSLGGQVWADIYCVLPKRYTVVGPICHSQVCFIGNVDQLCPKVGGENFVGRWCLLPGCGKTAIGPLCWEADGCFTEEAATFCSDKGGINFADRFCVLEGSEWGITGPTCYDQDCAIGPTDVACRTVQGDSIAGRFCVTENRVTTFSGPNCLSGECTSDEQTDSFCQSRSGTDIAGAFCLLPENFSQVIGPTVWNDQILEGPEDLCGGLFCAIPERNNDALNCPPDQIGPPVTTSAAFYSTFLLSGMLLLALGLTFIC